MNKTEEANSEHHYILLVVAIIIGIVGVYLRFADFRFANIIANIILISAVAICFKTMANILK
jgi:divalent metal cation (Fe/Co/Zn/Cd) transporter